MSQVRHFGLLLFSLTMVSCGDAGPPSNLSGDRAAVKTDHGTKTIPSKNPKSNVDEVFTKWKQDKISSGEYKPYETCAPFVSDEGYAIPPKNEIKSKYKDFNGDRILDGVFSFNPTQCDGGNALNGYIEEVSIISNSKGGYDVSVGDNSSESEQISTEIYPAITAPQRKLCVQVTGSPSIHIDRVYQVNGDWFVDYQQWSESQWVRYPRYRIYTNTSEMGAGSSGGSTPQSYIYLRWYNC